MFVGPGYQQCQRCGAEQLCSGKDDYGFSCGETFRLGCAHCPRCFSLRPDMINFYKAAGVLGVNAAGSVGFVYAIFGTVPAMYAAGVGVFGMFMLGFAVDRHNARRVGPAGFFSATEQDAMRSRHYPNLRPSTAVLEERLGRVKAENDALHDRVVKLEDYVLGLQDVFVHAESVAGDNKTE